ncbi:MAG: hypothetical protein ACOC44_01995 [Promethearchaeia archaeon]
MPFTAIVSQRSSEDLSGLSRYVQIFSDCKMQKHLKKKTYNEERPSMLNEPFKGAKKAYKQVLKRKKTLTYKNIHLC